MKNMKIGTREIKLLLYLGGVVLALLVYQFYFTKVLDHNSTVSAENAQLSSDVSALKELAAQQSDYESETKEMQSDIKDQLEHFPSEIKEEDAILYAKELQDNMQMPISSVGMTEGILMYTYGQGVEAAQAVDGTTPDAATTDTTAAEDTTTEAATTDATATDNTASDETVERSSSISNIMLYKMPVSISYTIQYGNLKKCLNYIKSTPERTSIDTVALSYDTSTGELAGTMDYGMYYITGTDKNYVQPKVEGIDHGKTNIFGGN